MAATRYVRYISFAFVCVVLIFLITSSSAPRITGDAMRDQYKKFTEQLKPHPAVPGGIGKPEQEHPFLGNSPVPSYEESAEDMKIDKAKEAEKAASKKPAQPAGSTPWNPVPSIHPGSAPGPRMNATFVTLARNADIWEISKSIRQIEDRFNRRFNYDWVFLNDKEFDDDFKRVTSNLVSGRTRYGLIPEEHWSFPEWIDQDKAADVRKEMSEKKIIYGDSISYRHMCRYESGFFFRHPIMNEYQYYWRVEPSVELYCDIEYDTFAYMHKNNKKYSFVISLYEYKETIATLWDSTKRFMKAHPEHLHKDNSMEFLSDDGGENYNNCHFWSNFEIGSLDWLRSDAYIDYFDQLDKDGGFFYERWGDAPVHSIGAGLTLPRDEIHFFEDIAYWHVPFTHCPTSQKVRDDRHCNCNPADNFDWNGYSCTSRFFDMNKMSYPEGTPWSAVSPRGKRRRIAGGVAAGAGLLLLGGAGLAYRLLFARRTRARAQTAERGGYVGAGVKY